MNESEKLSSELIDLLAASPVEQSTIENAIALLGASKAFKSKDTKSFRDLVEPGEYQISATIRFIAAIKVGEDYEQRIVAKANPWHLLAVALSKLNGVTIESIIHEANDSAGADDGSEIKDAANKAIAKIKAPTVTTCKGKVNGSASALIISREVKEC